MSFSFGILGNSYQSPWDLEVTENDGCLLRKNGVPLSLSLARLPATQAWWAGQVPVECEVQSWQAVIYAQLCYGE